MIDTCGAVVESCRFRQHLSAYHDGELDAQTHRQVAAHLGFCFACAAELAGIEELCAGISKVMPGEIDEEELSRMHAAIEREMANEHSAAPLLRFAAPLAALAASVLIVSGAWLLDLGPGSGDRSSGQGAVIAMSPDWERVAITLHADPRPLPGDDSPFSPQYAAAVNWMLNSLAPSEQKPWPKSSF